MNLNDKLNIGVSLVLFPYLLTIVWLIYAILVGIGFNEELFKFVGKDPALFILSILSLSFGVILLSIGYIEQNKKEKIVGLTKALIIIALFNLLSSLILASILTGSFIHGISLVGECQFIPMYNLLIILISVLVNIDYVQELKYLIQQEKGLVSLIIIFIGYTIFRVLVGPSSIILTIGLVISIIIIYKYFIKR